MTIELVDGHANKPHISGDDLGDFKAGILGNDGYVFNRANKLAATLNGSNSVTIATGSGILPNSGRHFRVTAPETLTITSGTQGQNRNDLCVVRASTSDDGTTVENAQLLILRGTPTSGSASDPATQEGDLVLYRFQLTGVSVAEPIALFDVMVPYNEFRDSMSREEYGMATSSSVAARGSTATEITFDTPFSEPPCVFLQDRSGGRNVSDMINNKTIVSGVTLDGFTTRSFNNTSTTFPDGMTFYWRAVGK